MKTHFNYALFYDGRNSLLVEEIALLMFYTLRIVQRGVHISVAMGVRYPLYRLCRSLRQSHGGGGALDQAKLKLRPRLLLGFRSPVPLVQPPLKYRQHNTGDDSPDAEHGEDGNRKIHRAGTSCKARISVTILAFVILALTPICLRISSNSALVISSSASCV